MCQANPPSRKQAGGQVLGLWRAMSTTLLPVKKLWQVSFCTAPGLLQSGYMKGLFSQSTDALTCSNTNLNTGSQWGFFINCNVLITSRQQTARETPLNVPDDYCCLQVILKIWHFSFLVKCQSDSSISFNLHKTNTEINAQTFPTTVQDLTVSMHLLSFKLHLKTQILGAITTSHRRSI